MQPVVRCTPYIEQVAGTSRLTALLTELISCFSLQAEPDKAYRAIVAELVAGGTERIPQDAISEVGIVPWLCARIELVASDADHRSRLFNGEPWEATLEGALLSKLKQLVVELSQPSSDVEGLLRQICNIARRMQIHPEKVRRLLLKAGIEESRASEIKYILMCPDLAQSFVKGRNTWQATLDAARLQRENAVALAARALIRKLDRWCHVWSVGDDGWDLQSKGGAYLLSHPHWGELEVHPV